jgi:hypothetical protein
MGDGEVTARPLVRPIRKPAKLRLDNDPDLISDALAKWASKSGVKLIFGVGPLTSPFRAAVDRTRGGAIRDNHVAVLQMTQPRYR